MTDVPRGDLPVPDGRVLRAEARRRARRGQILEAARRVFTRQGYQGASVQDILREAGIARGTFYLHFQGKRDALAKLVDGFATRLARALVRVDVNSAVPVMAQLHGNLDRVFALVEEDRDLTDLLFRHAVGVDAELDETVERFYARVRGLIRGSLATGLRLGLVRDGDLDTRAALVFGAVREVVAHHRAGAAGFADRDLLTRELLDFVLRGVLR